MSGSQEPVTDALGQVWSSTAQALEGIDERAWDRDTACPGWSVRDHLSHLIGIERTLAGDPQPEALEHPGPHVRNDIGALNEAWVDERRSLPGPEVLAEFQQVTDRRLAALAALEPTEWDRVGPSPIGQVPYRRFMWLRVMDSWVHEQDIRQALGRPGGRGGAGERQTIEHVTAMMPYVIGRKVAPEEGTTVVWELVPGQAVAVEMVGGRARPLEGQVGPPGPTVEIRLDPMVYWRLGCGRISGKEAQVIELSGDQALGRAILDQMNFMI